MNREKEIRDDEMKERAIHQAALQDIRAVLSTKAGVGFVKYLLKSFDITMVPDPGASDIYLRDQLGMLRVGNSIFSIIAQANPEVAGVLLGQIEKEKYVQAELDSQHGD